jgi:ribosomal subunit interface protein
MKSNTDNEDRMNIVLRYRGLAPQAVWQESVVAQLKRLQSLAEITSARVILEWQREAKPAFQVHALLEMPGPDFHAAASDHTLQAALSKAVKNLERQIRSRNERRTSKQKANLWLGWTVSHCW